VFTSGTTVAAVPTPVPVAEAAGTGRSDAVLMPEGTVVSVVPLAAGLGEPADALQGCGAAVWHGHCPTGGGPLVPAFADGTPVGAGALEGTLLADGGADADPLGIAAESVDAGIAALGTAALGTAALGTAALGTAALGSAALGTAAEALGTLADAVGAEADALATGGTEMEGIEEPEGNEEGGTGGMAGGTFVPPP